MAIVMKKNTMALCMAALVILATALSSCYAQDAAGAAEEPAAGPERVGDGRDGCYLLNFPWCRNSQCKDFTKDKNAYCNSLGECCPSSANSTAAAAVPPPAALSCVRKSLRENN